MRIEHALKWATKQLCQAWGIARDGRLGTALA
jgi:hypothetical protein